MTHRSRQYREELNKSNYGKMDERMANPPSLLLAIADFGDLERDACSRPGEWKLAMMILNECGISTWVRGFWNEKTPPGELWLFA